MALVELEKVSKIYPSGAGELVVLDEVDFSMEPGELVSITGESGSGKSTLLNILCGLDDSSGGKVITCGYPVSELDENALAGFRSRELGMVFQFHFLLKELTALENVMMPGWMSGMSRGEATEKASQLLDQVGLSQRTHHYPGQLSGGERQRVSLARALVRDPKLILADEPTGNLDEENSRIVQDMLFSLVEEKGASLILVTHDPVLASRAPRHMKVVGKKLVVQ